MKIVTSDGQQFVNGDGSKDFNYIAIEIAAANGVDFIKEKALIDTGSSSTVISTVLAITSNWNLWTPR